jgi:dethiobiotin synthetase
VSMLIVSGTGTGVGKTVVTAAVAALARERGAAVAVVKPAQTGTERHWVGGAGGVSGAAGGLDGGSGAAGGLDGGSGAAGGLDGGSWVGGAGGGLDGGSWVGGAGGGLDGGSWAGGDLAEVRRLAGVTDLHELARYPDPLSPEAAARASGRPALRLDEVARQVAKLAAERDLVLVEGVGGLLVRFADDGWTLADLARALAAPVLVVTAAGLGTLNHTALTLEVLAGRGLRLAGGLVVGCWPAEPDLAARSNVTDLETLSGRPLGGAVPAGAPARAGTPGRAGTTTRAGFAEVARHALGPEYGGRFDAADFRQEFGATARP